jgi:succinyl-diaminopimelate desuccinylase
MSTTDNSAIKDATVDLARTLVARKSVSPDDGGCQDVIADYLQDLGFEIETLQFEDVTNLWATRGDKEGPTLVFAGHTDVVPPGPEDEWQSDPFEPTVIDDLLYGRGAADMKGSLAAMMTATRRFIEACPDFKGPRRVIETLAERQEKIDWCVVGEPSSNERLGDVVRIGRRGSLNAKLTVKGIQGHVAYPDETRNPIHLAASATAKLVGIEWDKGNPHFPPTSMQISNIHAGTGANNVVPGKLELLFNFRFSTESTAEGLKARTESILDEDGFDYDIDWSLSGDPFLTTGQRLIDAVQASLQIQLGYQAELSTSGGTSDGRFISPYGAEVIELGPRNATIHKVNECVSMSDLVKLSLIYTDIMQQLLANP